MFILETPFFWIYMFNHHISLTRRLVELKGLRHGPYGPIYLCFLDTFFLFLIYTEVGAVIRSFQGCLSESGRDKGDSPIPLTSYLFINPRQQNEFS